jgi:hypothetical protein
LLRECAAAVSLLLIEANPRKPQIVEEAQTLKEFEAPVLLKELTGTMRHNVGFSEDLSIL